MELIGYEGKTIDYKFQCACNECYEVFDLTTNVFKKQDEERDFIPFSARSSHTTLICPKCGKSINFRVFFSYKRRE